MSAPPEVALLVGGGIGPELVAPVLGILTAAGVELQWRRVDVAAATAENFVSHLDEGVAAVEHCGLALKTKFLSPPAGVRFGGGPGSGTSNPNVELRRRLGLFAAARPVRTLAGLPTRFPDLDLLLIRENSEDIYKGIEHEIVPGVVQSLKVVTRHACERITHYAYRMVHEHGRQRITFVHKANIMKRTDGLFLSVVREIAALHPEIELREVIVDAACMQLVLDPYQFDVILTGNLYGDILSSVTTGLAGGISVGYSINVGEKHRVFEALHGNAPTLVGKGTANPLPLLSPALALLRQLEFYDPAERILAAVSRVLKEGTMTTADLGGNATTEEMCGAIIDQLAFG